MLLLTSVILLIGFIALSAMVVRVTQLPEETTQDSRRPIDLEAEAVAEGVATLLQRMQANPDTDIDTNGFTAYKNNVEASLATLVDLEKGRGFRFTGTSPNCAFSTDGTTETVTVTLTVTLQDLDTRISVRVQQVFTGGAGTMSCAV